MERRYEWLKIYESAWKIINAASVSTSLARDNM